LINGKPKSSKANGDGLAVSISGKSMLLPGYKSLFATNFIVSGLGVISVYILIMGLPVLIISKIFWNTNLPLFPPPTGYEIRKKP
jgi:hypothetical protein